MSGHGVYFLDPVGYELVQDFVKHLVMVVLRQVLRRRVSIAALLRQALLLLLGLFRHGIFASKVCQWPRVLHTECTSATVRFEAFVVAARLGDLLHHLSDEALYSDLGIEAALEEVLTRDGHVAADVEIVRLHVKVRGSIHAAPVRCTAFTRFTASAASDRRSSVASTTFPTSTGTLLAFLAVQAHFSPPLDRVSLLILHIAHLIQHEAGLANLSPEIHKRILVKVLDMAALHAGLSLHEVALLRALKAKGVRDALLLVAVQARTVLLVALILEATGLETEHLWHHHADELGEDAHFLILRVLHLVRGSVHEGATLLTVVMHVDEGQDALRLVLLAALY